MTWLVGSVINFRACAVNDRVLNSISGKTRKLFVQAHQDILIQSVDNNLTIIQCKNGDFSLNLSKVSNGFRNPKGKLGVTTHFSEIIKQQSLEKKKKH